MEETCNVCAGVGAIWTGMGYFERCPKCLGKGKLDWLEMMFGVREGAPSNFDLYTKVNSYARELFEYANKNG